MNLKEFAGTHQKTVKRTVLIDFRKEDFDKIKKKKTEYGLRWIDMMEYLATKL